MDPFLLGLAVLGALLTANRYLAPRVAGQPWALGALLLVDLAACVYVAGWGLPGVPQAGVRWVVVAALAVHVAMALSQADRARWEAGRKERETERRRGLREGQGPPTASEPPEAPEPPGPEAGSTSRRGPPG